MTIDEAGYVTWINGDDEDAVADFAKLALDYAKANNIQPVKSSENEGEFVITTNEETGITSGTFSNLELGYYLVDSTMGALCGLTTTNPDASINSKNGSPTLDKQIEQDSTSQWGDKNTADIGQIVKFRVTINVHAGVQNYVFYDVMSDGLTVQTVTKVERIIPGTNTTEMAAEGTDYTLWIEPGITEDTADDVTDGCTFELRFPQAFCDHLETNDKIIIYYEAMLNRNAVVGEPGNSDEAWISYGEDHSTARDTTTTYTYGIDIIKTDSQNTLIDGAEFRIYDAPTGGNEVAVVMMDDGVTYRCARTDESGVAIVVKDGKARVVGLDNGTYYLEETVAPAGYNKLTSRQKFIISDGNLDSVFNGSIYSTGSGVHVVNKTGSMLPETGAGGTVAFIALGTAAVLGAGILLVTKKRMGMIED